MVYAAGGFRPEGRPVSHANGIPQNYMHEQSGQELRALHSLLSDEQTRKKSVRIGEDDPYATSKLGYGPAGLMFEDLTYTVTKKMKKDGQWISKDMDLLHQVAGFAPKAMVTAVMGPSGAGKSTFLDALAGRIATGSLGGIVKLDGHRVSPTLIKRVSAYVMQDDQLFPMLTVWETLMFAAEVRLGNKVSREEKRMRVVKLIDQLGLNSAQNTFIGDEGHRGVSGGERRRVSIGVDIIHGPSLLFLDEPTSGLDSTSAFSVIEKVHAIAESGSTVLLTIHQPSFRIQQLLNHLIVLARGKLVYQGPPSSVAAHLSGMNRKVPKGENSIEYLLDVIQEYDRSAYGVDPLMIYARDGVPPANKGPLPERTPTLQPTGKSLHAGLVSPGKAAFSPGVVLKPVGSEPRGRDAPINPFLPSFEEDIGAFDDYDHSLKSPWVGSAQATPTSAASTYYKGLADTFRLTPKLTPRIRMPAKRSESSTNLIAMAEEGAGGHRSRLGNHGGVHRNAPAMAAHYVGEIGPATPTPQANHYQDYNPEEADNELSEDDYDPPDYGPKYANSWMAELLVLIRRNFLNIRRTPELFLSRQMVLTVMAIVLATLFHNTHHDPQGVTNLLAFFIFTVCLFFFSSNDAVPAFIQERFIFIRETSHNSYRSSSYVISGIITYLPFLAVQALTYCLIVWWTLHLGNRGFAELIFFWLVLFSSLLTTNSFVMFVSSMVPNFILGYAAVIAFTALFFLTCGYFLKRSDVPPYWIWLHFISTIKYPYEALLLNQFSDPKTCYLPLPAGCGLHGPDILDDLSIDIPKSKWHDLAILLCWGIVYRILFYCVLRFGSKNQRR
ncbi:hypothetical protein GOP47_0008268 [Adiantum capillus-veneris]|uniref:ABC transporter G family member STR2 n=1 Tax=Adiantum capillus-veneris TaxID=13818 RepID=A0A9D4UZ05_ADICA|nr:hypothetical protein GOP47_0008268 [Adiantum capillus-veneris]